MRRLSRPPVVSSLSVEKIISSPEPIVAPIISSPTSINNNIYNNIIVQNKSLEDNNKIIAQNNLLEASNKLNEELLLKIKRLEDNTITMQNKLLETSNKLNEELLLKIKRLEDSNNDVQISLNDLQGNIDINQLIEPLIDLQVNNDESTLLGNESSNS